MVEVFNTNVHKISHANRIINLLLQQFPGNKINFDMHDCDKILRIEGQNFISGKIIRIVKQNGFTCAVLEY